MPATAKEGLAVVVPLARLEHALDVATGQDQGFSIGADSAADPRDIGYEGTYPQINTGFIHPPRIILEHTYRRSAAAKVLVDHVARDTWAPWLKWACEDEALLERLESFCRNPTGQPGGRPLWWWLERGDKPARRDGRALLYFILEDATGDPSQKPARVRGIRGLQVIPYAGISGVEIGLDAKDRATYNQPKAWLINVQTGPNQVSVANRVHPDRVIAFIPNPKETDEWDGISVLEDAVNYIEWGENINYAAAEAFGRRASPMVSISIEPGVSYDADEKIELRKQIKAWRNNTTQILVAKGIKAEVLTGTSQLPDPTPYHEMALDNLAMVLGVPKAILTGDAAGDLASSQEDSRRHDSRMKKVKEQYADPIMRGIVNRLLAWDFQNWPLPPEDIVDFTWNGTYEPTAKETAELLKMRAESRAIYSDRELPLDKELAYEGAPWPASQPAIDLEGEPIDAAENNAVLTGPQVGQLVDLIARTGKGELGVESAISIIVASFPIPEDKARVMVLATVNQPPKPPAPSPLTGTVPPADAQFEAGKAPKGVRAMPGQDPAAVPGAPEGGPDAADLEEDLADGGDKPGEGDDEPPQDLEANDKKKGAQDEAQKVPRGLPGLTDRMQRKVESVLLDAVRAASKKVGETKRHANAAGDAAAKAITKNLPDALVGAHLDAYKAGAQSAAGSIKRAGGPVERAAQDAVTPDDEEIAYAPIAKEVGNDVAMRVSKRIRESLLEGIDAGEGLRDLTARIQDQFPVVRGDAERIARTETVRAYNQANRDSLKDAGFTDFIWVALAGADEECMARDGQRYGIDELVGEPPLHPNCRCTTRAVIPGRDFSLSWATWNGSVVLTPGE